LHFGSGLFLVRFPGGSSRAEPRSASPWDREIQGAHNRDGANIWSGKRRLTLADVKAPYVLGAVQHQLPRTAWPSSGDERPVRQVQGDAQLKDKPEIYRRGRTERFPVDVAGVPEVLRLVPVPITASARLEFYPLPVTVILDKPARSVSSISGPSKAPTKSWQKSKLS